MTTDHANRTTPLRRRRDRSRRRRPARGDRGPAGRQEDRDHLEVAVRQGAHGDGRGRRGRRDGQREQPGQLAGALPRHHARRQVPEQLPDGRAAREGGAAADLGAGDVRRAVRPHQGRQDLAAQLRRPRVPAAGARRRPDRPGADPHPAAEDRLAAAGGQARVRRLRRPDQGLRRDHDHRAAARRRPGRRRVRLLPRVRRVRPVRGAGRGAGHRRRRPVATRSPRTPGSTPATATRWRCAPGRR